MFDLLLSFILLIIFNVPMLLIALMVLIDTRESGFYRQERIGRNKKKFYLFKFRTLKGNRLYDLNEIKKYESTLGRFLRKTKLNELPQLYNILIGDMSFVGPRPDVEGFADQLEGDDKIILDVRPGLTGPATLKYRNEMDVLSKEENPDKYNREVIWPDKVKINREYVTNWSFKRDIYYLYKTLF
ncbi:sugar transferase [Flavobacteriaceae bacterium R38]|nr:sugar transferase [Flavobacteriaceae bacterium R38]